MTKQEIIKQAYGEYWDKVCEYVDENGWCNSYWGKEYTDLNGVGKTKKDPLYWRPKSLQGIEDNNGWIKVESEKDLPKCGEYWTIANFDNSIIERVFPHPKFSLEFNKEWWLKYITHYKPIEKPKPPIY